MPDWLIPLIAVVVVSYAIGLTFLLYFGRRARQLRDHDEAVWREKQKQDRGDLP